MRHEVRWPLTTLKLQQVLLMEGRCVNHPPRNHRFSLHIYLLEYKVAFIQIDLFFPDFVWGSEEIQRNGKKSYLQQSPRALIAMHFWSWVVTLDFLKRINSGLWTPHKLEMDSPWLQVETATDTIEQATGDLQQTAVSHIAEQTCSQEASFK